MKQHLVVLTKNAIKGHTKTRLAATVGNDKALEVFHRLLSECHDLVSHLNEIEPHVYYSREIGKDDIWQGMPKHLQVSGDLGLRMRAAFEERFHDGARKVVMIGSDCPHITDEIIYKAFNLLEENDVVYGPAEDGGYYLVGLKETQGMLFRNIAWSTEQVLSQSIDCAIRQGLNHSTDLPTLNDVDEEADVPEGWL